MLSKADRKMLTDRVIARLEREKPEGCCTNEDLRLAINLEAANLVAQGNFIFQGGALTRCQATAAHECDAGWIAVPDPVLGDHVQARCPDCSP